MSASPIDAVAWNDDGLAPAIAQDATSARVLMLAWMNRASLEATMTSGFAHYWSRSRNKLWKKGETSGHVQRVREIRLDCDADALLLVVEQHGGIACHTGRERCFFRQLKDGEWEEVDSAGCHVSPLSVIAATIAERRSADPASSYVASLLAKGDDAILKKIGEEATETVIAAKGTDPGQLTHEIADLWFHCLVLLARKGLGPDDVLRELARRHGTSGLVEKASRNA
ncbi:MAG TPA: bifunctional phosphoribosyl-AMP cyclohydrolase/phosphoribosyl-ATP diphosphatase HisIE [Casimicrobiaceae bacterium]|nr:bifunctional phosphoribosyl-AMP cyclohydrolase/phosphoribosyl-ATP diphosphatase HisIE [Casimicrobiaceae bacterium]